jgi:mRNA-degrading endonuclease toxin of MazEF toxin-antitoxin module
VVEWGGLPAYASSSRLVPGRTSETVVLCHQITTLDRSKLTQRIGALPEPDLLAVEDGIRAAIDLDSEGRGEPDLPEVPPR